MGVAGHRVRSLGDPDDATAPVSRSDKRHPAARLPSAAPRSEGFSCSDTPSPGRSPLATRGYPTGPLTCRGRHTTSTVARPAIRREGRPDPGGCSGSRRPEDPCGNRPCPRRTSASSTANRARTPARFSEAEMDPVASIRPASVMVDALGATARLATVSPRVTSIRTPPSRLSVTMTDANPPPRRCRRRFARRYVPVSRH